MDEDDLSQIQRLKAAVHYTVGKFCEESDHSVDFSRQLIAVVSEATFKYAQTLATDAEMFAKHAKRSTINCDDIKLLARKSPALFNHISDMSNELALANEKKKGKKTKKRTATTSSNVNEDEDSNLP